MYIHIYIYIYIYLFLKFPSGLGLRLDRCRSDLLRNREMLDWCPSSHRGSADCSTGTARACSGATAFSKSAARAHCREVRSLLAFEMAARTMLARVRLLSASSFSRFHLASCMLCTGSHKYIYTSGTHAQAHTTITI